MNVGLTMASWVSRHALKRPERTALMFKGEGVSYADLDRRVAQAAHALRDLGVRRGDRVAVLLLNSIDFMEVLLACTQLGAIFVPINFRLSAEEIAFILSDSMPEVLVHHAAFAAVTQAVRGASPVRLFVQAGGTSPEGTLSY